MPYKQDEASFKERFDRKVERSENGCWIWKGTTNKPFRRFPYRVGVIRKFYKWMRVHRVAWEFANGPVPDGLSVCHKCNNSLCVNPAHLYVGTHQDNMRDMALSDRHGRLKLTTADAIYIKASKEQTKILVARFGVDPSTIKGIRNGKDRKHI